jgi:hypothetical protein
MRGTPSRRPLARALICAGLDDNVLYRASASDVRLLCFVPLWSCCVVRGHRGGGPRYRLASTLCFSRVPAPSRNGAESSAAPFARSSSDSRPGRAALRTGTRRLRPDVLARELGDVRGVKVRIPLASGCCRRYRHPWSYRRRAGSPFSAARRASYGRRSCVPRTLSRLWRSYWCIASFAESISASSKALYRLRDPCG